MVSFLLKLLGSHARRLESPYPQLDPRSLDSQSPTEKAKKNRFLIKTPQERERNGRRRKRDDLGVKSRRGRGRKGGKGEKERGEGGRERAAEKEEKRRWTKRARRWRGEAGRRSAIGGRILQLLDAMFSPPPYASRVCALFLSALLCFCFPLGGRDEAAG